MPLPRRFFALACLLALAASAKAADPATPARDHAPPADGPIRNPAGVKGYSVHEWGVFTIHPNAEFANAGLAAEWADCPKSSTAPSRRTCGTCRGGGESKSRSSISTGMPSSRRLKRAWR